MTEFMHREVPLLGRKIHRIGIVGNYGIDPKTFEAAN